MYQLIFPLRHLMIDPDFFQWIDDHLADDTSRLRLKYGHERACEILQIECRRKYASKLADTLHRNPEFIFPTALSGEQSTSDTLAGIHSGLLKPGSRVADLTAGLGIDAMAMARRVGNGGQVVAVERDEVVAGALRHNAASLPNVEVVNNDCRTLLDEWLRDGVQFDAVFIDPARRASDGGRVYALDRCEPDVVAMLPQLKLLTKRLIVKASPMLDIAHTLGLLPDATELLVLGTTLECKELDIICDFTHEPSSAPVIKAITIGREMQDVYSFTRAEESAATPVFGLPVVGGYVYDPYPAVMKAAPFRLLCRGSLKAIGPNTHLWCSPEMVVDFPGRAYKVEELLPYMSKNIKRYAARYPKISVTARNFDISSDALRAKLKVKDGDGRLFAVTAFNGQKLLITCNECK